MRTQREWAINQLLTTGECSRNGALQNYITRLGAIICDLQKEGWEIHGAFRKEKNGKDYIYTLHTSPYRKVEYKVEGGPIIIKLTPTK